MEINDITKEIIGAAIEVHKTLGPGLLEKPYELCLIHELKLRGLKCESQKTVSIQYKGLVLDDSLKLDLVVENKVIVELKATKEIMPVHRAQIMSYMKLSSINNGLIINFHVKLLKDGIERFIDQAQPS